MRSTENVPSSTTKNPDPIRKNQGALAIYPCRVGDQSCFTELFPMQCVIDARVLGCAERRTYSRGYFWA
jgi:hypothetical protein